MKKQCVQFIRMIQHWNYTQAVLKDKEFVEEREKANIIRLIHSLEKGLCLENPRLGFGVQKINALFQYCNEYASTYGNKSLCLKMAHDVIEEYIQFHKMRKYDHPDFQAICEKFKAFPVGSSEEKCGGTLEYEANSPIGYKELDHFFASRHSIRDFESGDITDDTLIKAIKAAQRAPSACNRQAVRVHIMPSEKICRLYNDKLDGIGGFAEDANKFILITGKVSAYQFGEYNQYIVSASIFATYLILALQTMQIGACMVQRPLQRSAQWEAIQKACSIPNDEQLVLMLAVGKMKPKCKVPVSKRFPVEDIVTFYK